MIVVSNSSPLVALSFIHRLDLLPHLYDQILIPEAVWQEVVVAGAEQPGREILAEATWLKQRTVKNRQLVIALSQDLDPGEAEAIALAIEEDAGLLIMDERMGRKTARHFGLNVMGIIGVLIEAKHRGLVDKLKPLLDQLRDRAGFRISFSLYQRVLADVEEN